MSIYVMSYVWRHAKVSGSELLVLLAMADFADDEGRNIYPSMQSLSEKARLSEKQTRRIVHQLVTENVIELIEAGGWDGKRNRANEYRIVMGGTPNLGGPPVDGSTGYSQIVPTVGTPAGGGGGPAGGSTVVPPVGVQSSLDPSLTDPPYNNNNNEPPPPKTVVVVVNGPPPRVEEPPPEQPNPRDAKFYRLFESEGFGLLTPLLQKEIDRLVDQYPDDWLEMAIACAVKAGRRHLNYVAACLRNWQAQGFPSGDHHATYHHLTPNTSVLARGPIQPSMSPAEWQAALLRPNQGPY